VNVIEEDRRAGPKAESDGDVGILGSIQLDVPTRTPVLDESTEDTTLRNRGFDRDVRGELSTLSYPEEPVHK
jgi:hypothetical protein